MTTTINGRSYKGIKRYKDAYGKLRYYLRVTGEALPDPKVGFRAFDQAYWKAIGLAAAGVKPKRPPVSQDGTIEKAVRDYLDSSPFAKLAPDTQRQRRHILEKWAKVTGPLRVATIVKDDIEAGMANRADKPPTANAWLYAVRALMEYCIAEKRYGIKADPTQGVKLVPVEKTGGFPDWTDENAAQFVQRWPKGTLEYDALVTLLCSGQRRGDVVRCNWNMVNAEGKIKFKQKKTGRNMGLPILPELAEILPPRDKMVINLETGEAMPFLLTPTGRPFTPNYFTTWFHRACVEAGLPELSTHGTRKLFAQRMRRNGAELADIMAWTGHTSEQQLRVYLGEVEQEMMADGAVKFMPRAIV